MTIGENIRKIRKSKGLTMKDIANKLEITEQAISQYERNIRIPNTKLIIKISNILNVSPQQLDPELSIWEEFDEKIDVEGLKKELNKIKVYEFLSQISTEDLIEELNRRDDFPIKIDLKH